MSTAILTLRNIVAHVILIVSLGCLWKMQIPLIRLILQIIGRKQINGRIRKFGLEFKCESVTKANSNLA